MGLSNPAKKYTEELPWTVREEHLTHYAARMLRLLGRRRAGVQNSLEMDKRLDAWLDQLESEHAVVAYLPQTEEGFFYVDGEPNTMASERMEGVKFSFKKNLVEMSSYHQDFGDAKEEVEVVYEGPPFQVGFNARYLIERSM